MSDNTRSLRMMYDLNLSRSHSMPARKTMLNITDGNSPCVLRSPCENSIGCMSNDTYRKANQTDQVLLIKIVSAKTCADEHYLSIWTSSDWGKKRLTMQGCSSTMHVTSTCWGGRVGEFLWGGGGGGGAGGGERDPGAPLANPNPVWPPPPPPPLPVAPSRVPLGLLPWHFERQRQILACALDVSQSWLASMLCLEGFSPGA